MPRSKTIGLPPKGKQTVKNSHTSPREIEARMKRAAALEYRIQGLTFAAIGERMGVDTSTAHDWVVRAIDELTHEPAAKVLKMELERLNRYQAAIDINAVGGDLPSIESALRIQDRRAKYLGLYPDGKGGGVHLSIGGEAKLNGKGNGHLNAEEVGINVTFITPKQIAADD